MSRASTLPPEQEGRAQLGGGTGGGRSSRVAGAVPSAVGSHPEMCRALSPCHQGYLLLVAIPAHRLCVGPHVGPPACGCELSGMHIDCPSMRGASGGVPKPGGGLPRGSGRTPEGSGPMLSQGDTNTEKGEVKVKNPGPSRRLWVSLLERHPEVPDPKGRGGEGESGSSQPSLTPSCSNWDLPGAGCFVKKLQSREGSSWSTTERWVGVRGPSRAAPFAERLAPPAADSDPARLHNLGPRCSMRGPSRSPRLGGAPRGRRREAGPSLQPAAEPLPPPPAISPRSLPGRTALRLRTLPRPATRPSLQPRAPPTPPPVQAAARRERAREWPRAPRAPSRARAAPLPAGRLHPSPGRAAAPFRLAPPAGRASVPAR